jgi:HEAT repeat protein
LRLILVKWSGLVFLHLPEWNLGLHVHATQHWEGTSELPWCLTLGQKAGRRTGIAVKPLLLALTAVILAVPLYPQEDSGASLTIRFADGTSLFHVGEIIPIELSFRASSSDAYDMETRNYDRSGRLNIEQFQVTPPGRDPLQAYFANSAFAGGGLGGPRMLSNEPQIMREDLNEWVALDRPGHYSVDVTSGRVSRRNANKDAQVELRSNLLEFDIVTADPAWQEQTVRSAASTLNMGSSTTEEKSAAMRSLRFLDTPASVHELVRLLGEQSDGAGWDEVAGLAGSRNQSLVVRELEQQMGDADIALTWSYLNALARLKFQLDNEPLPPYPQKDTEQQKIWNAQRQTHDKKLGELTDALYRQATSLVPTKRGTARAKTVQALLQRPTRLPGDVKPLAGLQPDEIASAFLNLSQDQQWNLLSTFWERLKVPAMIEPLKRVAEQPDMNHQLLRDVALRCLFDLDPDEAAPIFMEEIQHPHLDNGMFTVKGETLGLLPKETLPQFDQLLSSRIQQKDSRTTGLDAQLIGRYSTNAILPQVKATYESSAGNWDCVTEDGFVLYFLRAEPDFGVKRTALAPSFCMSKSLPAVIKMHRWSEVEPGIIARLNGSDLNRARQAAETLAKYGSPQAEEALWERMRRFHAQWSERADELIDRPGMQRDANEAVGFQYGLVESIGRAQAWLLNNEQIVDLENMTLGQERENVKQWHWNSPVRLNMTLLGEHIQASIGQYSANDLASLRDKLAQYPTGTKFRLNVFSSPEQTASALAAINDVVAEHGLQIEGPEPTD